MSILNLDKFSFKILYKIYDFNVDNIKRIRYVVNEDGGFVTGGGRLRQFLNDSKKAESIVIILNFCNFTY